MPRHKTGSAVAIKTKKGGKTVLTWYARVTFFEGDKRKERRRLPKEGNTKTAAREEARKMLRELDEDGSKVFDSASMTFNELARFYKDNYLIAPEYVNDRKVAGYRSKYELVLQL